MKFTDRQKWLIGLLRANYQLEMLWEDDDKYWRYRLTDNRGRRLYSIDGVRTSHLGIVVKSLQTKGILTNTGELTELGKNIEL